MDAAEALRIHERLTQRGIKAFIDTESLEAGAQYPQQLGDTLSSARSVVVLCGAHSLTPWQNTEISLAIKRAVAEKMPLISVILKEGTAPESLLSTFQWIDLNQLGVEQALAKLERIIKSRETLPQTDPGPGPYRAILGTRNPSRADILPGVFAEEDAEIFCGREEETRMLISRIKEEDVVAVIGASGCGKSSIARAGVIASLRGEAGWAIASMVPGYDPLHNLARTLVQFLEPQMSVGDQTVEAGKYVEGFRDKSRPLAHLVLRLLEKHKAERMLLLVDQWEDLYTLTQDVGVRQRFVEELVDAAETGGSSLKVVLTLRSAFISEAIEFKPLANKLAKGQVLLNAMNREGMKRGILEPIEKLEPKGEFEAGLVQRLLDEAGQEPGRLAWLQITLAGLWRLQGPGRKMTHAAYDKIPSLHISLADRAEATYARLAESEQAAMRSLCLRLVRTENKGKPAPQSIALEDLPHAERRLVKVLADDRLLVTSASEIPDPGPASGQSPGTVELGHSELLLKWDKLKQWIEPELQFLEWRTRFRTALRRWKDGGEPFTRLLWFDSLSEAVRWQERHPEGLVGKDARFIERSRRLLKLVVRLVAGLSLLAFAISYLLLNSAVANWVKAQAKQTAAESAEWKAKARQLAAEAEQTRTEPAASLAKACRLALQSFSMMNNAVAGRTLLECMKILPPASARFEMPPPGGAVGVSFGPGNSKIAVAGPHLIRFGNPSDGKWDGQSVTNEGIFVFSPGGRYLATSAMTNTVNIIELETRQIYRSVLLPPGTRASALDLDANAQWLVAADGSKGRAFVCELAKGECFPVDVPNVPHSVKLSPDAGTVAIGGDSGVAWVCDRIGARIRQVAAGGADLRGLAFSSNGKLLATAANKSVRIWDLDKLQDVNCEPLITVRHDGRIKDVAFSPDGVRFGTASEDMTARAWRTSTGEEIARAEHTNVVEAIAFNPDGGQLATASSDGTWIWNLRFSSDPLLATLQEKVVAVALRADGKLFATAEGNDVRLWETATGNPITNLHNQAEASGLAFSLDGSRLGTAGTGGVVKVWQIASTSLILQTNLLAEVRALAFSADGRLLALGLRDEARVLRVPGGAEVCRVQQTNLFMLALDPAGKCLATSGAENLVRIWDVEKSRMITNVQHDKDVYAVAFSRDGLHLATGSTDLTARVWQTSDWRQVQCLTQEVSVWSVAFDSSGQHLAVGCGDYTARIWVWSEPREVLRLQHEWEVISVAFGGEDQWLATLTQRRTGQLWRCNPKWLMQQAWERVLKRPLQERSK